MNIKVVVVLAIVLVALCLSDGGGLEVSLGKPVSLSYRCPCRFFESHVARANVKHLKILNTPNCALQIVARLKSNNRQVCIDPKLKWIQEYLEKALNKPSVRIFSGVSRVELALSWGNNPSHSQGVSPGIQKGEEPSLVQQWEPQPASKGHAPPALPLTAASATRHRLRGAAVAVPFADSSISTSLCLERGGRSILDAMEGYWPSSNGLSSVQIPGARGYLERRAGLLAPCSQPPTAAPGPGVGSLDAVGSRTACSLSSWNLQSEGLIRDYMSLCQSNLSKFIPPAILPGAPSVSGASAAKTELSYSNRSICGSTEHACPDAGAPRHKEEGGVPRAEVTTSASGLSMEWHRLQLSKKKEVNPPFLIFGLLDDTDVRSWTVKGQDPRKQCPKKKSEVLQGPKVTSCQELWECMEEPVLLGGPGAAVKTENGFKQEQKPGKTGDSVMAERLQMVQNLLRILRQHKSNVNLTSVTCELNDLEQNRPSLDPNLLTREMEKSLPLSPDTWVLSKALLETSLRYGCHTQAPGPALTNALIAK
ncbi:hypothetical protein PANDA_016671 [Ailuropoda melanoleuca]|uniref:Stromal cell-derived factor 1 n=1 Tax=Ailuropoda melanoleuca TaxID=9646 RepID=D2HW53_AILME|nr:hypothetical protein PANDA_016671 [Ailuropoda melanoleuca]